MIQRILVANRGEIACRVLRTIRSMGLEGVAVFSDADSNAPHVHESHKAIHIGAAPATESYLDMEAIIRAAKQTECDAVHPGYGFLSENAKFAERCTEADLIFIGPSAAAIEIMGNKAESKRQMLQAGVPCVPGYEGEDQQDEAMFAAADRIGFPLMVKAAAGGGGRGMRIVHTAAELPNALSRARSEALNAFGSEELILERAVQSPRHVEIQVFADRGGQTIHLGERDCSVQRRHQKVLEESPCPVMTEELRARMGAAAVAVAKAIQYEGAGTVEFLLDATGEFYFLEMNTRLQVEHPVTEMVTGQDLVEWQIRVANGEPLPMTQEDVVLTGHAIEARLYAEDPAQDFLPSTGPVYRWSVPSGQGVRVDSGVASGGEVSAFYDPMVAKVIAHGPTRAVALQRLTCALKQTLLFGPQNNRSFLVQALQHPVFSAGEATTDFIAKHLSEGDARSVTHATHWPVIAAVLMQELDAATQRQQSLKPRLALHNWQSGYPLARRIPLEYDDQETEVELRARGCDYSLTVGDSTTVVSLSQPLELDDSRVSLLIDGLPTEVDFHRPSPDQIWLQCAGESKRVVDLSQVSNAAADAANSGDIRAPMHGVVISIAVQPGDTVQSGQGLAVLEAMKMQHELVSPVNGTVVAVSTTQGKQVAADDLLIQVAASEPDPD